jgi:Fic family protein
MIKMVLSKLGYVSREEAETMAASRAKEALEYTNSIKPGDELINATRIIRKFGFRVVYALGDGKAEEHAVQLAEEMSHPAAAVDHSRMVNHFLPNVKVVNDSSLLR